MGKLVVLDRIRDIAVREPGRPALSADGRSIDYGELVETATHLGDLLNAHGVGPEDVVATVLPRGGNAIVAILGIWMSGAAYLPTDAKWAESRMDLVLAESATYVLEESIEDDAEVLMPGETGLRLRRLESGRSRSQDPGSGALNLAYVLYTSESTGRPHIVGVEFGTIDDYGDYLHDLVKQSAVHTDSDMSVLLSAGLSFDASLRPVLLLAAGARLIVAPDLKDGSWQEQIDCILDNRVTVLSAVPSWYSGLLSAGYQPRDSSVQLAFVGGEPVPDDLVRQLATDECTVVVQHGPGRQDDPVTIGIALDDVEQRLIAIVRETLGVPCTLDDNFFALGGGSLDALDVLALVREDFGVRVRLREFFRTRTIRELRNLIGDAG
ncbi:non-ribosomal peptide synthetase [Streptomyces scopuliridis]|uniref:Non-ribosomal peptide synthetase n=1 Tax=Streptomyces scopuliridis TaxID=452529 RepID=A0ACD4ZBL9_9ACTN|nr:non-ribosomal peptide synthetase [Streptomyces scopuliridis]WSB31516.1 non-ribosomal peptide synthetase [Streptomyces scopuliridis]WSB95762.1 non-ribosomal peptide synthetase [Streptomyces scopuliridis]WSC10531.1 non-ribosomal peptide synthetase [Streptomyces scopuliridis]